MKTKEEVIKEDWGEYYGSVKDFLNENGQIYIDGVCFNIFDKVMIMGCYDNNTDLITLPSLRGIEDNSGWIRIQSEADLPKTQSITEEIHCFIKSSDNEIIGMGKFSFGSFKTFLVIIMKMSPTINRL